MFIMSMMTMMFICPWCQHRTSKKYSTTQKSPFLRFFHGCKTTLSCFVSHVSCIAVLQYSNYATGSGHCNVAIVMTRDFIQEAMSTLYWGVTGNNLTGSGAHPANPRTREPIQRTPGSPSSEPLVAWLSMTVKVLYSIHIQSIGLKPDFNPRDRRFATLCNIVLLYYLSRIVGFSVNSKMAAVQR
jgi:hypothetical protein